MELKLLNTGVIPAHQDVGGLIVGNQKDDKVYDIQLFRQKHIQPQPQPHQISGETANFSGIYRLLHAKHPVAGELVVLKGSKFPSCGACNEPITFTLIRQADEIANDPDFA